MLAWDPTSLRSAPAGRSERAFVTTSVGNLAGWIASTQHLKPGAKMPSFNNITGTQLRALPLIWSPANERRACRLTFE